MFLRVMCWKELREHRLQALILTALGVLILTVAFPMMEKDLHGSGAVAPSALVFAWACGLVTGAIMLANERETHTQTFLDSLPRTRMQLWAAKMFVALALLGVQATVLTASALAVSGPMSGMLANSGLWLATIFLAGCFGLGCGMCGSALAPTVLAAIGWSVVVLFAGGIAMGLLSWIFTALVVRFILHQEARETLLVLSWLLTMPLPLAVSGLLYSRVDRQRRYASAALAIPRFRLGPGGLGLASSLWLSYRQGRGLVMFLTVAAFIMGPLCLIEPLAFWPAGTLLLGLLMGVATLGDEQFYGSFRFLAEQRLPLGRFWLFKVGSRFLVAVLLAGLVILAASIGHSTVREIRSHDPGLAWVIDFDGIMVQQAGLWKAAVTWLLYGFTFGHLAAMTARKSFVALAIGLCASLIALSIWVPSLISGGLPAWQIFAVPAGLVVLARLSLWAWATDRLMSGRAVTIWCLTAVAGIAFVAGCILQRVREIPLAPPSFDVAKLEASYPTRDQNPVRSRLIQAEERFKNNYSAIPRDLILAHVPETTFNPGSGRVPRVLRFGWPKDDAVEATLAETAAGGDWLTPLLEAAALPATPADDPRDEPLQATTAAQRAYPLGQWIAFRALYLQSRGQHDQALDLIVAQLALARHLMTRTSQNTARIGEAFEGAALAALTHWSNHVGVSAALLEKALRGVQRHEASRPSYGEMLRAEYLRVRELAAMPPDFIPADSESGQANWKRILPLVAVYSPWEKARRLRLVDAFFDQLEQAAAIDYPSLWARLDASRQRDDPRYYHFANRMPPAVSDEAEDVHARIGRLIETDLVLGHVLSHGFTEAASHFVRHCDVRAAQVRLALLIFQHRHGKPAEELKDLVPDILPVIPVDPLAQQPFRYRLLADEEWIEWTEDTGRLPSEDWGVKDDGATTLGPRMGPDGPAMLIPAGASKFRPVTALDQRANYRRLSAGSAIVWSTGPDGRDDGGKRQIQRAHFGNMPVFNLKGRDDMLYIVPPRPQK